MQNLHLTCISVKQRAFSNSNACAAGSPKAAAPSAPQAEGPAVHPSSLPGGPAATMAQQVATVSPPAATLVPSAAQSSPAARLPMPPTLLPAAAPAAPAAPPAAQTLLRGQSPAASLASPTPGASHWSSPVPACASSPYGPVSPGGAQELGSLVLHYKQQTDREKQEVERLQLQLQQQQQLLADSQHHSEQLQRLVQHATGPPRRMGEPQLPEVNPVASLGSVWTSGHGVLPPIPGELQLAANPEAALSSAPAQHGVGSVLKLQPTTLQPAAQASPNAFGPQPGCRSVPTLGTIGSWEGLYQAMCVGSTVFPAMLDLEQQQGSAWRIGSSKRWHELKVGWDEVLEVAGSAADLLTSPQSRRVQYELAAQKLDAARLSQGKLGFPSHLKNVIMPKRSRH